MAYHRVALSSVVFFEKRAKKYKCDLEINAQLILEVQNGLFEKPMQDFLLVVKRDHSYKLLSFLRKSRFSCTRFRQQTDNETDKQTDRQIDGQTDEQTGKQTSLSRKALACTLCGGDLNL